MAEAPRDVDGGASRGRHRAQAQHASSAQVAHGDRSDVPASPTANGAPDVQKGRIISWDGLWPPLNDVTINPKQPSRSSSGFKLTQLVVGQDASATAREDVKTARSKM